MSRRRREQGATGSLRLGTTEPPGPRAWRRGQAVAPVLGRLVLRHICRAVSGSPHNRAAGTWVSPASTPRSCRRWTLGAKACCQRGAPSQARVAHLQRSVQHLLSPPSPDVQAQDQGARGQPARGPSRQAFRPVLRIGPAPVTSRPKCLPVLLPPGWGLPQRRGAELQRQRLGSGPSPGSGRYLPSQPLGGGGQQTAGDLHCPGHRDPGQALTPAPVSLA